MQSQMSLYIENVDRFNIELNTESAISLIFISLNILSCSYVLSQLYSTSRQNGTKLLGIKHPFYFVALHLMFSITQIMNFLINNSSLSESGILCNILGKFSSTFLNMNLLLTGFLEFSILSKIIEKTDIETGNYDNYMWQALFLLSWVASIFGINRYEQLELKYTNKLDTGIEYHANAILIYFVLLSAISYYFELRTILYKIISQGLINKRNESCDHMNPNFIRACLFSILPFLFQWSLFLFYNIVKIIGRNDLPLNIFLIIAAHIGGIGHAISYFIYKRKYHSTNSAKPSIHSNNIPSYGAYDQKLV